jgi:ribonuclease HI
MLPRVKTFLWRVLHEALPLAQVLNSRIGSLNAACTICGAHNETVHHTLFSCDFARACWFGGPLSLKTGELHQSVPEIIKYMHGVLNEVKWGLFTNSLWATWRCRNDKAYGGKAISFALFLKYLEKLNTELQLLRISFQSSTPNRQQGNSQQANHPSWDCAIDGAWTQLDGGVGIIVKKEGQIIFYTSRGVKANCAMHAAAIALLTALEELENNGIECWTIKSDCLKLVNMVDALNPPLEVDWRAFKEVYEAWRKLKMMPRVTVQWLARGENEEAHMLATHARMHAGDFTGFTYPILLPRIHIMY